MTRSLKKLLLLPLLLWKLQLPHLLLKLLPLLLLKLPLLLLTLLLLLPLTLLLLPPLTLLLLTLPRLTLTPLLALLPPSKHIAYAVMGLRPHGEKTAPGFRCGFFSSVGYCVCERGAQQCACTVCLVDFLGMDKRGKNAQEKSHRGMARWLD